MCFVAIHKFNLANLLRIPLNKIGQKRGSFLTNFTIYYRLCWKMPPIHIFWLFIEVEFFIFIIKSSKKMPRSKNLFHLHSFHVKNNKIVNQYSLNWRKKNSDIYCTFCFLFISFYHFLCIYLVGVYSAAYTTLTVCLCYFYSYDDDLYSHVSSVSYNVTFCDDDDVA